METTEFSKKGSTGMYLRSEYFFKHSLKQDFVAF